MFAKLPRLLSSHRPSVVVEHVLVVLVARVVTKVTATF
jgi:hypothetical protein